MQALLPCSALHFSQDVMVEALLRRSSVMNMATIS